MSVTDTYRATQDSYTDEANPTRNYGGQVKLGVDNNAGNTQRTYIGFSLKAIPKDAVIKSALLRVYLRGAGWTGANTITARRITTNWGEKTITWNKVANNNVAAVTATNEATVVVTNGNAGDLAEINVTAMITDAVGGQAFKGIRLTNSTSGQNLFHSSETSSHAQRPKLVVEYAIEPDPPTNLRPRASHAVNAAKPKLAWDSDNLSYSRVITGSTSAKVGVATNGQTLTGTPDYDSGWVANTSAYWDLNLASAPTFTALADTDPVYWRVAIKSADGDISDFSEEAYFERHVYGTLSITSPAIDGDGVEDSSPTIIFDFTGQTQTGFGYVLYRQKNGVGDYKKVYEQDREATVDESFEIPKGYLLGENDNYRLFVRVWDEYDRANVPGELSYVEDRRDFIYDPTAGVTPVSALLASQSESMSPIVTLTWTRASAPDSYDIKINGDIVAQKIDPANAFISGTSYSYDVYETLPRDSNVFKVIATENAQDSTSNPTATLSPSVSGVWLVAPDDGLVVPMWGKNSAEVTLGETGTTFELLNRPTPVRIVDSIRGFEGTVSGILDTVGSITAREAYDALMDMKSLSPAGYFRLIFGPKNIPIILGEVSVAPTPDPEERYEVSIQWWQAGEFDVS